ncbi:MAG: L-threonylcarbamoyladenylate synthase [Candidatus Sumerlaeaceae bacterium]
MDTLTWKVSSLDPDPELIANAAEAILDGKLVAFPTETVYGLGANAMSAAAIEKLFTAKGRPATNPIIIHIVTRAQLERVVSSWPAEAEKLAHYFWPGPLTLILPKKNAIPANVTAGTAMVGVRVPDHPVALALLNKSSCPIAAPSANLSNAISPTTAKHVLSGLSGRIDAVLDGGPCKGGIESTVLTLSGGVPRILRPGLIDRPTLEMVLGKPVLEDVNSLDDTQPLSSPGQLPRHYSPKTPLELVQGSGWLRVERLLEAGRKVGWLTFGMAVAQDRSHPRLVTRPMPADPVAYSTRLYAALHELDAENLDRIVCAEPPDRDVWTAIRDRLKRAAGQAAEA